MTQGMFVGSVSDNFNERIEQKIFHCEIVVDADKGKREESAYKKIPVITDFTDADEMCIRDRCQFLAVVVTHILVEGVERRHDATVGLDALNIGTHGTAQLLSLIHI